MTQNLTELTQDELINIEGGNILEDLLHGLGYGVGLFAGALYNAANCNLSEKMGSGIVSWLDGHHHH